MGVIDRCSRGPIDLLSYGYDGGNQVVSIHDQSNNPKGFIPGDIATYTYDGNGNMNSDPNKGIDTIYYNFLNLPDRIIFEGGGYMDFTYDASGKRHAKRPNGSLATVYYNEFENELGEWRIYHDEGRIMPLYDTLYEGGIDSFRYDYVIRDHLGNGRTYFSDIDASEDISIIGFNELIEENHYYPFGLEMEGPWITTIYGTSNPYSYNSKEWVENMELNWFNYGARWHDPAVARWWVMDAYAEKYYDLTPYSYAADSPVTYIDVNGDSLAINFENKDALTAFKFVVNNGLEGQFGVDVDEDGNVSFVEAEGGGDVDKLSEHGKAFYSIIKQVIDSKGKVTLNATYSDEDTHTGRFNTATIDMADVLQFNAIVSDLGGTQLGKVTHEIVEQYKRQVKGAQFKSAHADAILAENSVNQSQRVDPRSEQTLNVGVQKYTRNGRTVTNRIYLTKQRGFMSLFRYDRKILKVEKQ